MATARGSNGIVLKVDIATVDTAIGLLEAFKAPKGKVITERLEPLDSDHSVPVYVGRIDNDTATFGVYLDLLDSAHSYLLRISNDPTEADAGALKTFTAELPIAGINDWVFTGIVEEFDTTMEKAALMKGAGTIQVEETTQLPTPTS